MTVENASQFPKPYYCRHMQPGTARYEREGIVLIDTDAVKNLIKSGKKRSIPVFIGHQDVDLKNIKEQAVGYVSESFYNEMDGWAWFKFIAVDDAAHDAIKKGHSVSNAYMPTEMGPGGTKNNVPYKSEIRNGEFTHLAIVPDPRYEGACIMSQEEYDKYQDQLRTNHAELKNSKGEKTMFKMFKTKREEVTTVDGETEFDLGNGETASLNEMINSITEQKKEEKKFMVDGVEMTADEIVNAYTKMKKNKKTKKNGTSESKMDPDEEEVSGDQEDEGDDEIGEDKKNKKINKKKKMKKNAEDEDGDETCNDLEGDEEDESMKNKKVKKNSVSEVEVDDKYFNELRNAHLKPMQASSQPLITLSIDQIERGKKRYGSEK